MAAVQEAEAGGTPFGAALAMGEEVFATAANRTAQHQDATAHAEMEVIRKLSAGIQKKDLSGYTLYSTCEPCPMCMSAAIWANIRSVVYGCGIPVISTFMDQIQIRSNDLAEKAPFEVHIHKNFMEKECRQLLEKFA